jgi:hypothetical protein
VRRAAPCSKLVKAAVQRVREAQEEVEVKQEELAALTVRDAHFPLSRTAWTRVRQPE